MKPTKSRTRSSKLSSPSWFSRSHTRLTRLCNFDAALLASYGMMSFTKLPGCTSSGKLSIPVPSIAITLCVPPQRFRRGTEPSTKSWSTSFHDLHAIFHYAQKYNICKKCIYWYTIVYLNICIINIWDVWKLCLRNLATSLSPIDSET